MGCYTAERELQTAAALQQANIVPVLSAGDTNGLPYYTMPFVEGESLRARLARGPLSIQEVVGILRDVARALAFARAPSPRFQTSKIKAKKA